MAVAFECRTRMPFGQREAFDRARDIGLHAASMSRSRERAVGGVTAGLIGEGEEVTWSARHFGVRMRLTSRITRMDAPHVFVDEQVRGPFRSFRHEHRFEPDGDGTLMVDLMRFEAPLGVLGRLAELVLGPYMRRLIERRNEVLATRA